VQRGEERGPVHVDDAAPGQVRRACARHGWCERVNKLVAGAEARNNGLAVHAGIVPPSSSWRWRMRQAVPELTARVAAGVDWTGIVRVVSGKWDKKNGRVWRPGAGWTKGGGAGGQSGSVGVSRDKCGSHSAAAHVYAEPNAGAVQLCLLCGCVCEQQEVRRV
jgi:hypothetical protein